eukprot:gene23900-biopygen4368
MDTYDGARWLRIPWMHPWDTQPAGAATFFLCIHGARLPSHFSCIWMPQFIKTLEMEPRLGVQGPAQSQHSGVCLFAKMHTPECFQRFQYSRVTCISSAWVCNIDKDNASRWSGTADYHRAATAIFCRAHQRWQCHLCHRKRERESN